MAGTGGASNTPRTLHNLTAKGSSVPSHSSSNSVVFKSLSFLADHGYKVGTDGSVWSRRKIGKRGKGKGRGTGPGLGTAWKKLRPALVANYQAVALRMKNGHRKMFKVHTLVLLAFRGPRPRDMECRHLNGKKDDNRLENLAWGTKKENAADNVANGTHGRGTNNPSALLSWGDVRQIRWMYATGEWSLSSLAKKFMMSKPTIWQIVKRRSWQHDPAETGA